MSDEIGKSVEIGKFDHSSVIKKLGKFPNDQTLQLRDWEGKVHVFTPETTENTWYEFVNNCVTRGGALIGNEPEARGYARALQKVILDIMAKKINAFQKTVIEMLERQQKDMEINRQND